jgi:LPS export ABC transporter permease LptF/LPS export ABC transporter permease LptG
MRLLDRYLLREFTGYAALGLGVFLFILLTPEVLRLSELLARENVALPQMGKLFLSSIPAKLAWAIPLGVLAGLLMGLSRAAADSEVVALQSAGISPRRLMRPVLYFASAGALLTLVATCWWGPVAARTVQQLQTELAAGQISYEIKPRVFDERLPDYILYVQDITEGAARWRGVFLAKLSEPANPTLTLAESGVMVPDFKQNDLRIHLTRGSTHVYSASDPERYSVSTFAQNVLVIPLPERATGIEARQNAPLGLAELWRAGQSGERWRSARADFHRRLALPSACLAFGLIALPLGLLAERTGRAIGFVAAVAVALGYYFLFLFGDRMGREGNLSPGLGVWLANLTLLALFLYYLFISNRLRRPNALARWFASLGRARVGMAPRYANPKTADSQAASLSPSLSALRENRWPLLPRTLDLYVARGVLFHSTLLLLALLLIFALFTVLELVDEIAAHGIAWSVVARFLWYLLPQGLYWLAPLALLLGVLVELALLSKRNELVAVKGAGISLYRVSVPLLGVGLAAAALLFSLDAAYLPYANQRQEILRNQIKGRPPQTFFQADRRWIFGEAPRIYHYAFFDPDENLLGQLNVLELETQPFGLRRRLFAQRARWDAYIRAWVLQQGWERSFHPDLTVSYRPFVIESHPELTEPPSYFQKEVRESAQMNWTELADYIAEMRQSGFDTTRLTVQWHKKFAYPLMAAIMVLLAFPFGLTLGSRGALGGLALGISIGFLYWVLSGFLEAVGNLALLPPLLAGWGSALIFLFAGVYLFLRIET